MKIPGTMNISYSLALFVKTIRDNLCKSVAKIRRCMRNGCGYSITSTSTSTSTIMSTHLPSTNYRLSHIRFHQFYP